MVAASTTTKRVKSPFSIRERFTAWWVGLKSRTHRRYRNLVKTFQFWSTVGFWMIMLYYAGTKGWAF